jgi:hypothetical protein
VKEMFVAIAATIFMAVGIAACGGAGSAVTAHKLAKDPQVQQDVQKAKAKINKCGGAVKLINKSSRSKVISCLAPPGQQVQMERCISAAASKNHLWRKAGRQQFIVDAAGCIVQ